MCLLFLYIHPCAAPGEYKVIIAHNREEYYHRPSKPAHFWPDTWTNIGGTDEKKGKEGGTWLAMNRNGKIASFFNVLQPRSEALPNKKGRGFLVNSFIQGQESSLEYLQNLRNKASEYYAFLLVTMDTFPSTPTVSFYDNTCDSAPVSITSGVHVFGSSPPTRLWEKATQGKKRFEEIVRKGSKTSDRENLLAELLLLLKDRTAYLPGDQLRSQGKDMPNNVIEKLNTVFYSVPDENYGTRCHTVILIDGENKAEYVEFSMKEPIDIKGDVQWVNVNEMFHLQENLHRYPVSKNNFKITLETTVLK